MALATEEEWETDPELRAMRQEFVASFAGRKQALEALFFALGQGAPGDAAYEQALKGAVVIAHKLAGAAETYGFPSLTSVAAALEDWFNLSAPSQRLPRHALAWAQLLAEMLGRALSLGKDAKDFAQDPRCVELFAAARAVRPKG